MSFSLKKPNTFNFNKNIFKHILYCKYRHICLCTYLSVYINLNINNTNIAVVLRKPAVWSFYRLLKYRKTLNFSPSNIDIDFRKLKMWNQLLTMIFVSNIGAEISITFI